MLISMLHHCVSCMGKCSICNIWSVIVSERKMIVLLFAFYALCHFGSLIIITKYYSCEVADVDSLGFLFEWGPMTSESCSFQIYHSTLPLDCKYLDDGDPPPNGPVSISSFTFQPFSPLFSCVYFITLIFHVYPFFYAVSAILYSAALENQCVSIWYIDMFCWPDKDQFPQRFSLTHILVQIPSPNLTRTFLFFYISCVYMYSASVCPVVDA